MALPLESESKNFFLTKKEFISSKTVKSKGKEDQVRDKLLTRLYRKISDKSYENKKNDL